MPSENRESSGAGVGVDRRTRKREARRDHLLDLAADLVERAGVDGLTMTALAEAADYAPASLYTYFPSRSALLAALQRRALVTLAEVAEGHLGRWDAHLAAADLDEPTAALARLWAFAEVFLAAPDEHPREFRLQQELLVSAGAEETADAVSVVPVAMLVLDVPRRLLAAAVDEAALEPPEALLDPLGEPIDGTVVRTFAWLVALNGALLVDGLAAGLPATGAALGRVLTESLLGGWGASPAAIARGREVAAQLRGSGSPPTPTSPTGEVG